ncbi:hypothetical protein GLAREA_11074 [Glarea lozoyensis ATCC 20868]|uniref:Uncharacterized protein n=1 Tax=Glarea lozoyensis (strain ATCC 20868 / MF5171) TaxID=1116229 RepID=S3DCD6_GLAL2|nr:uncharacterized protein GLAREA_11074 [Glarea lozoyensis ATCC 20868]EPE35375.1 hypothetical protein GLAREA_11074 [Glarea lozoyensis ATCC 20868]
MPNDKREWESKKSETSEIMKSCGNVIVAYWTPRHKAVGLAYAWQSYCRLPYYGVTTACSQLQFEDSRREHWTQHENAVKCEVKMFALLKN